MSGLHVLAYDARPAPRLLAADGEGALRELPLAGAFDWRVGGVRRCVGRWDGEPRRHVPCPAREPLALHAQCGPCSGLEDAACVFEPRCARDPSRCHCVASFKGVPHAVYVAFFGTLPKVGMTQARRLEARLREQGADAGFAVQRHAPGRPEEPLGRAAARQVERRVAFLHGIPEHRSHRETLPQLARPVPWPELEARAQGWMERLRDRFDVEGPLLRVADHPLAQPLEAPPRRVAAAGRHHGCWVGAKGQNLVYRETSRADRLEAGARLAAVKASDLVGRSLSGAG